MCNLFGVIDSFCYDMYNVICLYCVNSFLDVGKNINLKKIMLYFFFDVNFFFVIKEMNYII